jgi:nucleoside 2-deoxyribosyltransferase
MIESISTTLSDQGIETVCITRDIEKWGKVELTPRELMRVSFEQIDRSDFVLLEMTEKGVGLGIEAGYARATGKLLIVLTKDSEHMSTTIKGIADCVIQYHQTDEIDVLKYIRTIELNLDH